MSTCVCERAVRLINHEHEAVTSRTTNEKWVYTTQLWPTVARQLFSFMYKLVCILSGNIHSIFLLLLLSSQLHISSKINGIIFWPRDFVAKKKQTSEADWLKFCKILGIFLKSPLFFQECSSFWLFRFMSNNNKFHSSSIFGVIWHKIKKKKKRLYSHYYYF